MSIEVLLFVVVGALAVGAAVMMLLSENAVHSALFLIVNFVCVAFLYLMLDASFLAMVQIAVYAGAIMVLFLFVIMLLGAERVGGGSAGGYKWVSPLALTLAMSFLFAVSLAIFQGQIDSREIPGEQPLVRVMHFAPGFEEPADVFLNGELVAEGVLYRDVTDFMAVEAGEYSVSLGISGEPAENAFPIGDVAVETDQVASVIAYGELDSPLPEIGVALEDLSTAGRDEGRITIFNAYAGADAVNLVDPGTDFVLETDEEGETFIEGVAFGTASEVFTYEEGDAPRAFVASDNPDSILLPMPDYNIEAGTSQLIVLAGENTGIAEELNPVIIPIMTDNTPQFGGPASVGQSLFTRYVLPFQMVAMLLLAAMVGAIVITQRVEVKPKPGRPTRRKVSRPLTSVIASQTGHDVYEESPQLEAPDTPEPAGD